MPHVSFRAALLAGAFALVSTAGFVLSAGPGAAQDATTNSTETQPAAPTPAPDAAAPAAPAGEAQPAPTAETAPAPAPADPNEVVATVNGKQITRQDVINSASDLPPQLMSQLDQYFPQLLNRLIGIQLVVAKGRAEGLAEDPEVKKLVAQAEEEAISRTYIQRLVKQKVTDEAIQKAYEADIAANPPQVEIQASHILVKTEDEAKEIIKQLEGGADFATLAKEKSTDEGSAKNGGELGMWFTKGTMVKEFSDAAFAMQRGEVSKVPVKSQFGWHIIKVTDSRVQTAVPLDQRKDDFRQALTQETVHQEVETLIKAAKVEYGKDQYKLPLAPSSQP
jgi:peptidyl-prolyl cis-trans isomerase C